MIDQAYLADWNGKQARGYAAADGNKKDLRRALHPHAPVRWSRTSCGGGILRRCRAVLASSLTDALRADPAAVYRDEVCADAGRDGDPACFDAIWHRPLGGMTEPLIPWQNRPTFQQVVEIPGRVGRSGRAQLNVSRTQP